MQRLPRVMCPQETCLNESQKYFLLLVMPFPALILRIESTPIFWIQLKAVISVLAFDTTNTWSACLGSWFPVAAHPGWAGQESRCPQSDFLFMSPWLCKLGHRANVSEGEGEIWRGKKKKQEGGFTWKLQIMLWMFLTFFSSHPLHLLYRLQYPPDRTGLGIFLKGCQRWHWVQMTACPLWPEVWFSLCVHAVRQGVSRVISKQIRTRWRGDEICALTF